MAARAEIRSRSTLDNRDFKKGVDGNKKAVDGFKTQLGGLKSALVGAFSIGVIVRFTKSVIDMASEIRHQSDNLGISTKAFQALNTMALRYGVSIESVARLITKVKYAQGQLLAGDKTMLQYFKNLKIQTEDFVGLRPEMAMEALGRAVREATNESQAFVAIMRIIGERVGPKAMALLKDIGTVGMEAIVDGARKAGTMIEDDLLTKLELLGTQNDLIVMGIKVAWAEALGVLLSYIGVLNDFSNAYTRARNMRMNPVEATTHAADVAGRKYKAREVTLEALRERQRALEESRSGGGKGMVMVHKASVARFWEQMAAENEKRKPARPGAAPRSGGRGKGGSAKTPDETDLLYQSSFDEYRAKQRQLEQYRALKRDEARAGAGDFATVPNAVTGDAMARQGGRIGGAGDPELQRQRQIAEQIRDSVRRIAEWVEENGEAGG